MSIQEQTVRTIVEWLESEVATTAPSFARGDSPIEDAFLLALYWYLKGGTTQFTRMGLYPQTGFCAADLVLKDPETLILWRQVKVIDGTVTLGWPADFVVGVASGDKAAWLIIECDGHDFHERTKEQAARDRARDRELQANGFTIFRFTGSEIYRDPIGCASQVVKWAESTLFRLEFPDGV
jgi:hypothetical protein